MDAYIKAVEEIGFKKIPSSHIQDHINFHQKSVVLTIQVWPSYYNIFTSKSRRTQPSTEKAFNVFNLKDESTLPQAIKAIVRFWAKNGVKLGGKK